MTPLPFDFARAFASTPHARGVATSSEFAAALHWLCTQRASFRDFLQNQGIVDDALALDPRATPYDAVLRRACGAVPSFVDQRALEHYASDFIVAHVNAMHELAGPDREIGGLPGHVVIAPRATTWTNANAATLALDDEGNVTATTKARAVKDLERMRRCAVTYAKNRGWTSIGCYLRFFGCAPDGENERGVVRAHVVNLSRARPRLKTTSKMNCPIDDIIEALGGRRTTRRGSVIVVGAVAGADWDVAEEASPPTSISRYLERRARREGGDEERAREKKTNSEDRPLARAGGVNSEVPGAESNDDEVSVPETTARAFREVATSEHVTRSVRIVARNETVLGEENVANKVLDVHSFADDAQWMSMYKTLTTPARVTRALQEIHKEIGLRPPRNFSQLKLDSIHIADSTQRAS